MRLAKRMKDIHPSLTLAITAKAKKMKRDGIDVVNFAAGEPDFDTPANIKAAAISAINEGFTKYTPSSGMVQLKEAISAKLKKDNGLDYPPSVISVSCGAKHSLYNIFQALCQEKEEVIIMSPHWLSYPEMARLSGAKPVFIKTKERDRFKLNVNDLKRAITKNTKALIINSPSNPTGAVYERKELESIADIAVSEKIFLVSDEVYEKLLYDGLKHISIASVGGKIKERSLVVNGVSKSYSMTGWRIGYVAGPQDVIEAINKLQSHSTSNPTSISQRAALEAISGDQASVMEMRKEFQTRRDYMLEKLSRIDGFDAVKPSGAFYIFCNIDKIGLDSVTLSNKLLEEAKVAVIPGKPFGSDRHIRLSFATNANEIAKGTDRIEKWVDQRR